MKVSQYFSNQYFVIAVLGLCAALSLGSYLAASEYVYRIGFPLDDAWIHQTYARNLGERSAWEFIPGQPSAGSTAPAWTLLLAIGYWLNLNAYSWTFLLGWLVLWCVAISAYFGFNILIPRNKHLGILAGMLVIFEWHLTWAAGSGMETLLAGLIALMVIIWGIRIEAQKTLAEQTLNWQWLGMGVLIGLGIWVRPDLISLLVFAGFTLILIKGDMKQKILNSLILTAGFLITSLPYILFNMAIAGEIWPNTFYAKQAEYAILRSFPLWQRYLNMFGQPLTGIGIVLLPGLVWFGVNSLRNRSWSQIFAFIWVFGYLFLYALRLPVTYQHGRYIMPVIPLICLFGIVGMVWLIDLAFRWNWGQLLRTTWIMIAVLITFSFWILGLRAYSRDVAIIESEMVEMAHWVASNTEEKSLLAAHDIGALGYFADRNLLDLAGLVSPEVIPFIRDEKALQRHMNESNADYLVTFPGWYPELVMNVELIHQTNGKFSPQMGGENMSVFDWQQ
ncbi:MAG: hypothetical protein JSV69_09340 [Chloroflexota bacterium]|nr:MAG: hypothetical protein JSV69_09340 [Chloroflexota bacterium]